MTTEIIPKIASDSGHWYDATTGEPRYTIIGANGKERPTTLRDARKHGYVPSVTGITGILNKPGLQNYFQRQMFEASITTPRLKEDTDDQHFARCLEWAKEHSRNAADAGTRLHGAIEVYIQTKHLPECLEWREHILNVEDALQGIGLSLHEGTAERSFAHPSGYGGRIDLSAPAFVIDFKSKPEIVDKKKLAWPEHVLQLAAYRQAVSNPDARLVNVFVGVKDAAVAVHEWPQDEAAHALKQFNLMLELWKHINL